MLERWKLEQMVKAGQGDRVPVSMRLSPGEALQLLDLCEASGDRPSTYLRRLTKRHLSTATTVITKMF